MRIFLVFRDMIYASGLEASLSVAPGVESVNCASSIASTWEDEALIEADAWCSTASLAAPTRSY